MKRAFKITTTTIITILLLLTAVFAVSGTVIAKERGMTRQEQQYLKEQESNSLQEIRAFLEANGYSDSGITMNRITNEDESMEYTVRIHHRKLLKLNDSEQAALLEELEILELPVDCNQIDYEIF